jgi:hypothetical protein
MPREPANPFTHVLVRTRFDPEDSERPWYWRREMWFNDPVIGAQPPDIAVDGIRRYKSQRAAMKAGLEAAAKVV